MLVLPVPRQGLAIDGFVNQPEQHGRARRYPAQVTVRLSEEHYALLAQLAAAEERDVAAMARRVLIHGLVTYPPALHADEGTGETTPAADEGETDRHTDRY